MTAEELFDLPDGDYKYELVEGELIRMAPTGRAMECRPAFHMALEGRRSEVGKGGIPTSTAVLSTSYRW